ncbi:hypothetical protein [Rhizobium sp. 21-4511-3d]|jgi:hypothetical protein
MEAGSRIPAWIIWLLAILSLAAFGWAVFGFVLPFEHETGRAMLDTYVAGYDEATVAAMQVLLNGNPVAHDMLRAMYLGPELVLPALLAMLLLTVILKLDTGSRYFGRPVHPALVKAVCALPILYALADYGENFASLTAFSDSASAAIAAAALPWLTKLKFAALAVTLIAIVRFVLIRIGPKAE